MRVEFNCASRAQSKLDRLKRSDRILAHAIRHQAALCRGSRGRQCQCQCLTVPNSGSVLVKLRARHTVTAALSALVEAPPTEGQPSSAAKAPLAAARISHARPVQKRFAIACSFSHLYGAPRIVCLPQ